MDITNKIENYLNEAKEERKTYSGDEVLSMLHKHVVSSKGQGKFGKDVVNAETGEVLIEGRKTYKALALEFYKAAYENSKKKLTPSTRQTHRSKVWSIYLHNKDGYETLSKNPDARALEYYSMRWYQSYADYRITDEGEKAKYHLY